MEILSLSKADRFFPLIASFPEDCGGVLALQNILDLKDSGMLTALRGLQNEISRIRSQSKLYDDALTKEPHLHAFFRFVDAAHEVAHARRVMDSGKFLTVTRQDGGNISFEPESFYLNPLKDCLLHIQERYGRFDWVGHGNNELKHGNAERVVAMTKWLLMKNHAVDYLMTFDVTRVPNTNDFMVKVPKWQGTKPISEDERKERLSEVEAFLVGCCHPGRLGVFPAATIQGIYAN